MEEWKKRMERSVQKENWKEKPGTSKNNVATQSNDNSLDLNNYLPYDILRIIFVYLNDKDLTNAAMVCRTWLEVANNEKRTRRSLYCFFVSKYLCNNYDFLDYVKIQPSIAFVFSSEDFEKNETLVTERMFLVPACCEAVLLSSYYCFLDKTLRPKWEEDPDKFLLFRKGYYSTRPIIYVFLPQIPNVRIKSFILAKSDSCTIHETTEYREIMSTINNHKSSMLNCETSTCFMLFCNDDGITTASEWYTTILQRKEIAIDALCGGKFDDIYFKYSDNLYKRNSEKEKPHCVAVLITGLIQTWFTMLNEECCTAEQIEARLKLFKDEVKLKKHSIGFIFADESRGLYNNFDESNHTELIIFKRLFSKLPLAGCFSTLEIGKTVGDINEKKNSIDNPRDLFNYWRVFDEMSIAFLILTYE